jgi:N-acetylglucosamine-6-phosphate deacetylase
VRLHSERIITPGGVVAGEVTVVDGRISGVGPVSVGGAGLAGSGGDVVELGDRWLAPGFIDGHVHGGGGAQCNTDDPDEVAAVARFHARHGTTALLATTVSAEVDRLEGFLAAIAGAGRGRFGGGDGARVLGAHLEGPFLSRARPGAMDAGTFRTPDVGVLNALLAAGGVRMMTLAPELPGALELVMMLRAAGVVVSLGHSDATFAQACAAADAGATSVTHLFNAMGAWHHRAPGLAGAALDHGGLSCELIADGVHVDPAALRLALRARGTGGVRLVTDAIAAAGMGDGVFALGDAPVMVRDGRALLGGSSTLAGSTLTMDAAVAGAVRMTGVSVSDAVTMATAVPARVLGVTERMGAIAAGLDADLVVLDDDLTAWGTLVAGRWVAGPFAPGGVG